MRVLVIGAAGKLLNGSFMLCPREAHLHKGRVGSAALAACLAKNHVVTAFVRSPSKLPLEVRTHPRIRVVRGDATSPASLVEAIRDQDAIIQTAIYGSNSPWGTSDSEKVIRTIVTAIKEVQSSRRLGATPIRLWVLSGQVLLDIPGGRGKIEGDVIPIHPEHYQNYAFLQQDARDVDWSLLCPGRIEEGEVRVLLYQCR
ncbi:MAG: hypothetical protein OHK93_008597 [Ramalina farinacea]|uniref:NAD(P)-binding domain-containing protein n=1 Tax=Ramalina farinacea TaxID=258253 RepID=A0AA43QPT1_9LECA|nr:hypothetical protein [Ramalina farinacea]